MSKLALVSSAAALLAAAGVASAKTSVGNTVLWSDAKNGVDIADLQGSGGRTGQAVNFPVAGIQSFDAQFTPGNFTTTINVGPGGRLTGIGWDVNLTALGASWLSELTVGFTPNAGGSGALFLRPGAGSDFPGTATFANPVLKLVDVNIPDVIAGPDGVINLEFFEGFDDVAGTTDGTWNTGNLILQVIPTPGAVALFGIAGLAAARRRRA